MESLSESGERKERCEEEVERRGHTGADQGEERSLASIDGGEN